MTDKRAAIIKAGMDLWRQGGEAAVSARRIAQTVGMTHAGILYGFGTAQRMRNEIARTAVAAGDPIVIRKLIVENHPAVSEMSPESRQAWLAGA